MTSLPTIVFEYPTIYQHVTLRIAGNDCKFRFVYNRQTDCWVMSMHKNSDECATIAFRSVIEDVDLLRNSGLDAKMYLIRSGLQRSSDWFNRMLRKEATIYIVNASQESELSAQLAGEVACS